MSNAHEKLKAEIRRKREWRIFSWKEGGLKITQMDEVHIISKAELEDIMSGYLQKEFYEVIVDIETGHRIHVFHLIDLSRYSWLPKYMYMRFLRATCNTLGIPYKLEMLEAVTATRLSPKAYIVFPEKSLFDKAEKRIGEIKEREESMKREIAELRELMESMKEEEKK